ncbi:hypothetical protein SprV_0200905000 [Sparganum proliferum]
MEVRRERPRIRSTLVSFFLYHHYYLSPTVVSSSREKLLNALLYLKLICAAPAGLSPRDVFEVSDTTRPSGASGPEQNRGMELDRGTSAATTSTATSAATAAPFQCPNFVSPPPPPVPLMYPALPLSATQTGRYEWPPIPSATATITSAGTESVLEPPPSSIALTTTATTTALQHNTPVPPQPSIPA